MSRRTLPPFEYFEPGTLVEAVSLLSRYGEDAVVFAGGTDLVVFTRNRVIAPKYVVNISTIPGMNYIREDHEGLNIGALTKIRTLEESALIKDKYIALWEAAHSLGSIQVRNMATIGGNVCRASPSGDMCCALLTLDSKVKIFGKGGFRTIPIESFFKGPGLTDLEKSEILTEISVPHRPANEGTAFLKIGRTKIDLAQINVAVAINVVGGICKDARITLGAVAPTPIRAKEAEKALIGEKIRTGEEKIVDRASEIAASETKPITDVRATAEWRRDVSKILIKRAIKKAVGRVK